MADGDWREGKHAQYVFIALLAKTHDTATVGCAAAAAATRGCHSGTTVAHLSAKVGSLGFEVADRSCSR